MPLCCDKPLLVTLIIIITQSLIFFILYFVLLVFICQCPGRCSNVEDLPNSPIVSTPVAMATVYFSTFLILISLSFIIILLLSLLPTVTLVYPFASSSSSSPAPEPWPSPTCGSDQSWAVHLDTGSHYAEENGEHVAEEMDVIANRVQNFNYICI